MYFRLGTMHARADAKEHDGKLQTYKDMVQETVDLDSVGHEYRLLPTLDSELQRITDELLGARDELDAEHERVAKELGLEMDKKLHLENHQVYKHSLRITKAVSYESSMPLNNGTRLWDQLAHLFQEAGLLRKKGPKDGYHELATQKSGTIFTTTILRQASDDFQRLQEEYKEKQRFLVKEVVQIASSYAPVLETLDDLIAAVDVTVRYVVFNLGTSGGRGIRAGTGERNG